MTETKKTLSILKTRWPEVFLIIGLFILGGLSNRIFPNSANILYILFILSLAVILMLLYLGFLRTVHLEGSKKQTPSDLIKTGDRFFWRMVGFGIVHLALYFTLIRIIFLIIKYFTSIDTGFRETAKSNPLLYQLCYIATMLILIKVILFIPALFIVLDSRVFTSFKFLRKCKLLESTELVALYCLSTVMPLLGVLLKITNNPETISQYILRIGTTVIYQVLWLIISVSAVRFVSSLNLEYDGRITNSKSEDLFEYPTEE